MIVEREGSRNPANSGSNSMIDHEALAVLESDRFQTLIDAIKQRGYRALGPTVSDNAVIYDEISSVSDLPVGWTDEQDAATYRLTRKKNQLLFNYTVGPQSWKKFLHLPIVRLFSAARTGSDYDIQQEPEESPRMAFVGVRACELQAMAVQDRVLLNDLYRDPFYQRQRADNLTVAVNCSKAGGTCFCASMNTGPKAASGFDLALTEVSEGGRHYFVVQSGSSAGSELLKELPTRAAGAEEIEAASKAVNSAAKHMGRRMDTTDIKALLYRNLENSRFDNIAGRCLTCGNCTLVCPTCFCTNVEDVTDLTGQQAERRRRWDSCFTLDFSYIHGGSIRTSTFARYRKWFMHKLATWHDQFGSSGCVGCGRCITWCPVGIDITEEVRAIRESESDSPIAADVKE